MNQHIMVHQLMNLTKEQQNKLKEIADKHFETMEKVSEIRGVKKTYRSVNFFKGRYAQFFNIGKMIEILDDNLKSCELSFGEWEVTLRFFPKDEIKFIDYVQCFKSNELVDALFKAVCYVIKDGD